MVDDTSASPIKPVKHFVRGLAFPGIIIIVCAVLGIVIALLGGTSDIAGIKNAAAVGGAVGAFFSLFGVGEVIGAFLGTSNHLVNGVYQSLGYLVAWLIAFVFILPALF